jgi:hypothetical protein
MQQFINVKRHVQPKTARAEFRRQTRIAQLLWKQLPSAALQTLKELIRSYGLSVLTGDVLFLEGRWYVTHAGLLRLACRSRCAGIHVHTADQFCDPTLSRWSFVATVFKSQKCKGFTGYGDADPSNVSSVVLGAEMRVAETRAVNRALRKAYGIGICSVEEIGSNARSAEPATSAKKLPSKSVNGNGWKAEPRLRDRLCQLIRQHQLDPVLVKSYAIDFCGTKTLKEASREQVDKFVNHLADWATKDKDALLGRLNSYLQSQQTGAA